MTIFFILLVLLVSGCTSPVWWSSPDRYFFYRGYTVHVLDQSSVMAKCGANALGCVNPDYPHAFSVNNPVVLAHECSHIDAIEDGDSVALEWIKDLALAFSGINDLLVTVTGLIPAGDQTCGDDTGKPARYKRLPTLEEHRRSQ